MSMASETSWVGKKPLRRIGGMSDVLSIATDLGFSVSPPPTQDRIIARLQQPYSLDCIAVEAEYQATGIGRSISCKHEQKKHLWQLMVTKSWMSPLADTKVRRDRNEGSETYLTPINSKHKRFKKWYGLVDAVVLSRKKILRKPFLLNNELQRTLHAVLSVSTLAIAGSHQN